MGNINHSIWFSTSKRKVLILSFEDDYLQKFNQYFFNKKLNIPSQIGFYNESLEYKNLDLKLWFLSTKNRHLWRHHYLGTQGIILIFSCIDPDFGEKLIIESLNMFNDDNVKNVPVLIIFDKSNNNNMENLIETFRTKINTLKSVIYNIQILSFNEKEISSIKFGLDWLVENMVPI